jgi:hypothetical protein
MSKQMIRRNLLNLAWALLAFALVGEASYITLWHTSGLGRVTSDDNPGVVLGAVWCLGWAVISGAIVAAAVLTFTIIRTRRVSRRSSAITQ